MPLLTLGGQIALVTGGGRGIGANVARELALAGATVAVTGRTAEQVEEVARRSAARGRRRRLTQEDVEGWSRESRRARPRSTCSSPTPASAARRSRFEQAEPDTWWHVFEVNVLGVFLCCRARCRDARARGGRIVNIASGAAVPARDGSASSAYGASKAAVYRFSECWRASSPQRASPSSRSRPGS